jgi:ribonuclease P protein component
MSDNEFHDVDRLRKKKDFKTLFIKGIRLNRTYFAVYVYRRKEQGERVAFSAERRMGNAVCRNRAKRIMRQAHRLRRTPTEGLDILFIARKAILIGRFGDIESEMSRLFSEIQRIEC